MREDDGQKLSTLGDISSALDRIAHGDVPAELTMLRVQVRHLMDAVGLLIIPAWAIAGCIVYATFFR